MLKVSGSWLVLATLLVAFGFAFSESARADQASYIKEFSGATQDDEGWAATAARGKGGDNVAVPEPGTMALIGIGLAVGGAMRRRRKRNKS